MTQTSWAWGLGTSRNFGDGTRICVKPVAETPWYGKESQNLGIDCHGNLEAGNVPNVNKVGKANIRVCKVLRDPTSLHMLHRLALSG